MFQTALSKGLLLRQCNASKLFQSVRYFSSEIDFDSLVKNSKVVVFMKGTPQSPMCGFSGTVVKILKMYGVDYEAHNVLSDENMRQGIKKYTSWPTIPQIFINGEFIGGCDIVMQLHYDKKLTDMLNKAGVKCSAEENLDQKKEKKTS